ncbi:MAG: head-tail adaptor protein [Mycobacterium sp.]
MPYDPSGRLPLDNGIAQLRWRVTLYRRDQFPGPDSAITESFVPIATVHADVQPTYPGTFYLSAQVETPITHLIRIRWLDYVEVTAIIMRTTYRPTDRTYRTELFRVRRTKEIAGRKRFAELECELERVRTTAGDDDAERELLFAEHPLTVEPTA